MKNKTEIFLFWLWVMFWGTMIYVDTHSYNEKLPTAILFINTPWQYGLVNVILDWIFFGWGISKVIRYVISSSDIGVPQK